MTDEVGELVVLLQAAIEIASVERWALQYGERSPPTGLKGVLRYNAYEVTVVDIFHRLVRRYCERLEYVPVWERPLRTGTRGRPQTIDVSFFHVARQEERRIELGLYSKTKLRDEAAKLYKAKTNPGLANYSVVQNLIMLWQLREDKTSGEVIGKWMADFRKDAKAVSVGSAYSVRALLTSTVDMFASEVSGHRFAVVGLFDVQ